MKVFRPDSSSSG